MPRSCFRFERVPNYRPFSKAASSVANVTHGSAERVQICADGSTAETSSRVPTFNTAKPGLPLDSLIIEDPHFGQKLRFSMLPLSALSS